MKPIIAAAILLATMPAAAETREAAELARVTREFCLEYAFLADRTMTVRQYAAEDRSSAMQRAVRHTLPIGMMYIQRAWEIPVEATDEARQRAIADFGEWAYADCVARHEDWQAR